MPASMDTFLDASHLSWQAFMRRLLDVRADCERSGRFAYVRPPARCGSEARRAVRDLGITDCVQLLTRAQPDPIGCAAALVEAQGRRPKSTGGSRLVHALTDLL